MASLKPVEKLSVQDRIALEIKNMADTDDPTPILEMLAASELLSSDIGLLLTEIKKKTGRKVGDLKNDLNAVKKQHIAENLAANQSQAQDGYTYPENWFYADGWLQHIVESGHSTPYTKKVYPGDIRVVGVEENVNSGEYFLKITFPVGNRQKTVTVPLADIGTRNGVMKWLSTHGAKISEIRAAEMGDYIVLSYAANEDRLSLQLFSEKLGNCGGGLIAPKRSVGTPVEYRGKQAIATGYDLNALKTAFAEIATWDTWVPWLTMGAALFSPFTERLIMLQRNPIFSLVGGSGYGKSTVIHWGMSVWGNPTRQPLKLENPTQAGFTETVKHLGALPIYFDEIHTVRPDVLQTIIYNFANKTTRVIGTKDHSGTRGGESVHGVMLTSGEHAPVLEHDGAFNRIMIIPMDTYLPLGAERKTVQGQSRAKTLEDTIFKVNGLLGPLVFEHMHKQWATIEDKIVQTIGSPDYKNLELVWATVIAGIVQAIWSAMSVIQFIPDINLINKINEIVLALTAIADETRRGVDNPAETAWRGLMGMLGAASPEKYYSNNVELGKLMIGGDTVAWDSKGRDGKMRLLVNTDTKHFDQAVSIGPNFGKKASGVARYGQDWIRKGYIIPGSDGKPAVSRMPPNGAGKVRVIIIPKEPQEEGDFESET